MVIGTDAHQATRTTKTGTEWYTVHLLQEFARLDHTNEHRWYSHIPLDTTLGQGNPNVHKMVLGWPPKRGWTQARLSLEMALHAPDVLFVPSHTPPLLRPRATVTTVHDIAFLRQPELYSTKERLYNTLMLRIALHSSFLITPSEYTKQELLHLTNVDERRIVSVHHGFGSSDYKVIGDEQAISKRLHAYNLRSPYLLFVGRIQEKKNIPRLVEAFAQLKTNDQKEFQLVLVGLPDYHFSQIRQRIDELHLSGRIHMLGYVPQDDIVYLMNGATAFVFPSLYEGFGFPVLEAQACGTPVLTSTAACLPEIAGDAAYYVDPLSIESIRHGLERMMHDDSLRESLRTKGFINYKRFTWENAAKGTLRVLEQAGR